jgi:peptidoglycan-associated lipoprotein
MIKKNGYLLIAVLFGLAFMTACSKNLMPPEGLAGTSSSSSSSAPASSQIGQSRDSKGGSGRGFNVAEQGSGSGSGFLTEENVGESARSGENATSGPSGGSAERFPSEPFLGNDSGPGGSNFEEARTLPFKDTDSLRDIHFKFDRYDLDEESRNILRQNASYLKSNSSAVVEIQGHCDERGTNNYNIALGERRAQSTKMYLVSQGVSSRRIHTISYGEERPFCFNSNDACWLENRRAHFRVSE